MRILVYSLLENNGKTMLNIGLGSNIVHGSEDNDKEYLVLNLNGSLFSFKKAAYINSMRIIEKEGYVFTLCSKSVARDFVKNKLIEYQVSKLDTQAEHILMMKKRLQSEMVAA